MGQAVTTIPYTLTPPPPLMGMGMGPLGYSSSAGPASTGPTSANIPPPLFGPNTQDYTTMLRPKPGGTGTGTGAPGAVPTLDPVGEKEASEVPPPEEDFALPPNWKKKFDMRMNRYYYYNTVTRKTQWKAPV